MKLWMIAINIASSEELDEIDNAKKEVLVKKQHGGFIDPVVKEQKE
jgi:hypothetical protein